MSFDNIINFRDVGASINSLGGSRILKEGVLFRSARPDDASEEDKRQLSETLRIATVIDLRSTTEHQMAARKRQAQTSPEDSASPDDQVLGNDEDSQYQHLMHLPHCNRSLISLTGPSFERALIARLDWWSYLRVLALIVAGYRTDAVRIVCSQVMTPRGLIGLAQDTLANSTAEIKHVFDVLSNTEVDDAATYPVLIHCTQGKDRTGLLILLLLCLAGVHQDLITGDYVKSEAELLVEFEERMEEIRVLGLDEEYTKCPSGFAGAVLGFLQEEYGGVDGYLEGLGIGKDVREGIRARLVAE